MSLPHNRASTIALGTLLVAGVLGGAAAAFALPNALDRLAASFAAMAIVTYSASQLTIMERIALVLKSRTYRRRFLKMRFYGDQILSELRRMNGLAIDGAQGVRSPDAVTREMEAAEARVVELARQARNAAGEIAPGHVDGPDHARQDLVTLRDDRAALIK